MTHRVLWLGAALLLGMSKPANQEVKEAKVDDAATAKKWMDTFTAHPDARSLCHEHVSGVGMHIQWESYALKVSPEEARAYFAKAHPKLAWEDNTLVATENRKLSIHAAGDSYPSCETKPEAGEKTVVIVSLAGASALAAMAGSNSLFGSSQWGQIGRAHV